MRFRAVTLDAGGTLFRPVRPVGDLYAEVSARHGCPVDARALDERFRRVMERRSATLPGTGAVASPAEERAWWRELVDEVFGERRPGDFDRFFDELHGLFAEPGTWHLYPEVPDALSRLRDRGLKLAIVSNWDTRLEPLCRRLGIRGHFDAVVASAAVGASKPSGRIFAAALGALGVAPDEAAHVGDSLRDDVWGARQHGLTPVWLRRGDRTRVGNGGDGLEEVIGRGVSVIPALDGLAALV